MSAPSHRPRRTAFASLVTAVAIAIAALPALADARPVADHGMPAIPVNAPGTNVAAVDQQAPRPVVNAPGTNVAAVDQQAPIADTPGPVSPADGPDGSLPTLLVFALIALGVTLAGLALATTRRRARTAA